MPSIDATEDAWSRLGLYLSRDVLARRYEDRHGLVLSAAKANEIIAHFEQGQQYFKSAQSAGALVGPLEQYYGILAFARGLILYLEPRALEATLKRGHGLKAAMSTNADVEDIEIIVEDGTFSEFLRATENVEQATVDSLPEVPGPPRHYPMIRSLPAPPAGSRFSLRELMSRVPGVLRHYEEAFGTRANCFQCSVWVKMGALHISMSHERMGASPVSELPALLRLHPNFQCVNSWAEGTHIFALMPLEDPFAIAPHIVDIGGGDERAVIAPFPDGWVLSKMSTYYAAAYAMSMLVRYYPTVWARLLTHSKGDRAFPVLERVRALLQAEFIMLLLWELERSTPQGALNWPELSRTGP